MLPGDGDGQTGRGRMLLRPHEAAAALGISRSRVYELVAAFDLPAIHIGGSVRIPIGALELWISEGLERQRMAAPALRPDHVRAKTRKG